MSERRVDRDRPVGLGLDLAREREAGARALVERLATERDRELEVAARALGGGPDRGASVLDREREQPALILPFGLFPELGLHPRQPAQRDEVAGVVLEGVLEARPRAVELARAVGAGAGLEGLLERGGARG